MEGSTEDEFDFFVQHKINLLFEYWNNNEGYFRQVSLYLTHRMKKKVSDSCKNALVSLWFKTRTLLGV